MDDSDRDQAKGRLWRVADWPQLDPFVAVVAENGPPPGGRCAAVNCRRPPRVTLEGFGFCREHWPDVRRRRDQKAPETDLDELYGRREALVYLNERLAAAGLRTLSEGTFIKRLYEDLYPETFALEPLRLGERTGPVTEAGYAWLTAFTRRMLNAFVDLRAGVGGLGPVRPTDAERAAFLPATAAIAWLNDWWAERRIDYRVERRMMNHHRKMGRLPAVLIGNHEVYTAADLLALAEQVREIGGWERRPKKANWRSRS